MRERNPDFIDRYLGLERKVRRRRTARFSTHGDWTDLRPYLNGTYYTSQVAIPMARNTAGYVELAGAVLCYSDAASDVLFSGLPSEFGPQGGNFGATFGVTDIFLPIDYDNFGAHIPVVGGWSADVNGPDNFTANSIILDPPVAVMNTATRALAAPGAGNNNGRPRTGTVLILSGIGYLIDGAIGGIGP